MHCYVSKGFYLDCNLQKERDCLCGSGLNFFKFPGLSPKVVLGQLCDKARHHVLWNSCLSKAAFDRAVGEDHSE